MSDGLPPLRDVIDAHGLRAKKSLGQNFLLDLNLTSRIARTAGSFIGFDIIEVGPGPGGLTRALLAEGAERVIAIERDPRCLAALAEIQAAYPGRLEIIEGDALAVDLAKLSDRPKKIVANLPYNVATPLLVGWLESEPWPPFFKNLSLMFQKEVADRITAQPGSKAYGRLSILAQWRCEAELMFDVDRLNFTPPPKVTSSIVRLTPRPEPLAPADAGMLNRVVRAAFGQRRKMVRASLKPLGRDPLPLLEEAGITQTARAETLSIEQFCALARAYSAAE